MTGDSCCRRAVLAAVGTGFGGAVAASIGRAQNQDGNETETDNESATGGGPSLLPGTDDGTDSGGSDVATNNSSRSRSSGGAGGGTDSATGGTDSAGPDAAPDSPSAQPGSQGQTGSQGQGQDQDQDQGPISDDWRTRIPETVRDNGVTVQFRNCSEITVMGDLRDAAWLRVNVMYHTGEGYPASELFWYEDPTWFFQQDVREEFDYPENADPVIATDVAAIGSDWGVIAHAENPQRSICTP